MRLILNLKDLNSYISPPHFKLEDWRTVVRLMLPNTEMATLDIEDAYLSVPIHPTHKKFLRFQWRGVTYEFSTLPFGLSTAPFIFTKIIRPVISFLREEGFESIVYLDDFLLLGPSKTICRANVQAHINLLSSLGFTINFKKSELEPAKERKYLGFIFNSVRQSISIPTERREKLFEMVSDFSFKSHCSIREFARMIGSLVSIAPAVRYGPLRTKLFEREKFLALIRAEGSYSAQMRIPSAVQEDFQWWRKVLSNPHQLNYICTGHYALEIFSDACLTGWGASCGPHRSHGWWSEEDRTLHINALELKAAFFALKCFASNRQSCEILLRIDNTTALSYINRFGSVQHPLLSSLARDIWLWCEDRDIFLFASYIASADNVIADRESRSTDADTEWSLSDQAFDIIAKELGPFDMDLFASLLNTKCDSYVSWIPDPGSLAVDAFTLSWKDCYFYAFPPFILIPRVLRKIINDKAEGILVVPWWPSQPWFPLFRRLLASEPLILGPSKTLLSSPLRNRHPAYRTLSLAAAKLSWRRLGDAGYQSPH